MRTRRNFITLLGGAAAAWPLAARAQRPGKVPTIGLLGPDASVWRAWTDTFVARLRELGWIEGRTVAIEYRWSEGHPERYAELAADLVRQNVDVILTNASNAATTKQATSVIPIVFVLSGDPVAAGLVPSLARPGGNVTGLSNQQVDLAGKRLELLREVIPALRRLAILADLGNSDAVRAVDEVRAAARMLGIEVVPLEIRRPEEIATAFETLKSEVDGLYVTSTALININRTRIITLAQTAARLPTIFDDRGWVQAGGLMSYGASFPAIFQRAAELVDKVLRGTKPGDIPVEQPTKFELVVNLTTAKAIGMTIPESFLARADEVIE